MSTCSGSTYHRIIVLLHRTPCPHPPIRDGKCIEHLLPNVGDQLWRKYGVSPAEKTLWVLLCDKFDELGLDYEEITFEVALAVLMTIDLPTDGLSIFMSGLISRDVQ